MITYDEFKKLDLRIAQIIEVTAHPNADKLYLMKIDIGGEIKQIVAGIRLSYPLPEFLVGRKVVVVNNLEPAVIRGAESNGMILAASGESGPVVLFPEKDVPAGTIIK
jgi:methionyl-tRNA synthetase